MPRFSLSTLALIIVLATSAAFIGLGSIGYLNLQRIVDEHAMKSRLSAALELDGMIFELEAWVREESGELADWDAARTQLSKQKPETYTAWKRNEVVRKAKLATHLWNAEYYTAEGLPLASEVAAPLPKQITEFRRDLQLARHDGTDYMIGAAEVRDEAGDVVLGYVLLAVSVIDAIEASQSVRSVDLTTLRSTIAENSRISSSDFSDQFFYRIVDSDSDAQLIDLWIKSFYQFSGTALAIVIVFYLLLMAFVGLPMRRLSTYIDKLKDEQVDPNFGIDEGFSIYELEKVRQSMNEYHSRLEVVNRGLDRKNQRLWKLTNNDPLTGCLNRQAFENDWTRAVDLNALQERDVSLILIDCNHFKAINDTYGHDSGDLVLKGLATTLRSILTESDRVYRIAGDEFAVIFLDTGSAHAEEVARDCSLAVSKYDFSVLGIKEPVRVSIGIAHSRDRESDIHSLYRRANVAVFNAKRPGGPGISVYSGDNDQGVTLALSNRAAALLDEALNTGDNLQMQYQPVIDLSDQRVCYYESLVRVKDGDKLISPEEFFLQIETRRLEAEFDNVVLSTILKDLASGRVPQGTGLSINLSAQSLVADDIEERLSHFTKYFSDYRFVLEITETTLITRLQLASERLGNLRKLGFTVALDDFGSGYSSLRYLADMPVDVVKFDISLVHALCEQSPRAEMLANLVALIKQPGYKLVAEGVESESMVQRVSELGFDYAQGYVFGRPKNLDHL